jgi:hypothetical protein
VCVCVCRVRACVVCRVSWYCPRSALRASAAMSCLPASSSGWPALRKERYTPPQSERARGVGAPWLTGGGRGRKVTFDAGMNATLVPLLAAFSVPTQLPLVRLLMRNQRWVPLPSMMDCVDGARGSAKAFHSRRRRGGAVVCVGVMLSCVSVAATYSGTGG